MSRLSRLLLTGVLLMALVPVLFPVYWLITTAFKAKNEIFTPVPQWLPSRLEWENFALAWQSAPFDRYFTNSVVVSLAIVVLQLVTASLAAFALARFEFRGRRVLFVVIVAALVVPIQITFIANFVTLQQLHWIDTYAALIAPFSASAFGTFLLRQAFRSVPSAIEDAARLDRCVGLPFLWYILLPLSRPTILAFSLVAIVAHWNDYFWPLIVTNSDAVRTIPIGLGLFIGREVTTDWNLLMAAVIFSSLPMVLLFLATQRYFVSSFLRGGMKG